jgi:hypothetical protein
MDNTVAKTILEQLGGAKFQAMTGAYSFSAGPTSLGFRISQRNKGRYAGVRIELTPADVYDMHFIRSRMVKGHLKIEDVTREGVYCDSLVEVFERETGLFCSLGTMGRS